MKKVILITGASRGLGKVIYETLSLNKNYKVYGTSRHPHSHELLELDVTKIDSVIKCITDLISIEGQLDVLINNVGSNLIGSLEGTTIEEFHKEMDLNFFGGVRLIQEVLPHFRKANSGRIINISSLGSRIPLPYNSSYGASKSALESMSESLYYELINSDIHVSIVSPIGLKIEDEQPNLNYINREKSWNTSSSEMYANMKNKVSPNVSKIYVARKISKIIKKSKPKLKYHIGFEARVIIVIHKLLPSKIFYYILKKAL